MFKFPFVCESTILSQTSWFTGGLLPFHYVFVVIDYLNFIFDAFLPR